MKTIYLVTSGEYSDYHVEACFSSKEKADVYIQKFDKVHSFTIAQIETYHLDDPEIDALVIKPEWCARVNLVTGEIFEDGSTDMLAQPHKRGKSHAPIIGYNHVISRSYTSQKHANKLAVEARQKWLRENPIKADWRDKR